MKYMVGFHSHTECSVASTVSPGVLEQLVAVRGEGGDERKGYTLHRLDPPVRSANFF